MTEVRNGDEGDWYLGDEDTAIVYMCGVDWQHHTLCDPRGVVVYGSEEIIEEQRRCLAECGLVEIEMKVRRWVRPQNIGGAPEDAP
jgi:hypothetical protein